MTEKWAQTKDRGSKGQRIQPEKDLFKDRLHLGIPRRLAQGVFVLRTQAEQKSKLGNIDGHVKASRLLTGCHQTKEQ